MKNLITLLLILLVGTAYSQGSSTIYLIDGDSITDVTVTSMTTKQVSYSSFINGYRVNDNIKLKKVESIVTNGVVSKYNRPVTNNHLVLAGKHMQAGLITSLVGGTVVGVLIVTGVAPVIVGVAVIGLGVDLLILRIKTAKELKRAGQ